MPKTYDYTIIGGGIVGAMVAWRTLRRQPEWRVLWMDQSLFGLGASAYAGALLTPFGQTPDHRALLSTGFKLLDDLEKDIGALPVRKLAGWYIVSPASADERRAWFLDRLPDASIADNERLCRLMPNIELRGRVALGPFNVRQGRPVDFIARITALCRENANFSLWEGITMNSWVSDQTAIRLSLSGEREITVSRLALATGPWATQQIASDVALLRIRVKRVTACHVEIPPQTDTPVLYLGDHEAFLLPLPTEKRSLLGFPSDAWDISPAEFKPELDDNDRASADSILQEYSSVLHKHRHGGRAFYDCYGTDRVPIASIVGNDPRVAFAGACAGSGFRYSPGLADRLLDFW